MKNDSISRQAAIDEATRLFEMGDCYCDRASIVGMLNSLPPAQPETYKEKLKEIADALSEKFAYMNTCLNERDIILGYLGVKRPSKTHCNTDCTNIKCESYRYNKRLPSAQPEQHEIGYSECANAMLKMWIDNVLTDGEYSRIMDKLNAHWAERQKNERQESNIP